MVSRLIFSKFFGQKLKKLILCAIKESYSKQELSITWHHYIITGLPKGNKNHDYFKHWRPISLLNETYKILSAAIASRLKMIVNNIISPAKTGFLKKRFIGESTRLVYNIMNYCEKQMQSGLLMLIDFDKTFDSVS